MTYRTLSRLAATLIAAFILLLSTAANAGQLGADVNADVDAFGHDQMNIATILSAASTGTVYPIPLFNQPPNDHVAYWDSQVEQYQAAQLDFVAVWLKGNKQPATFANLAAAIHRRGLDNRLKVMPFDDNPASWTAIWNFDHGNGYNYTTKFDMSDPANWEYVWTNDLSPFFAAVPDQNRYKVDGRPAYAIWSAAPAFVTNLNGNGSKFLAYIRKQCQSTFGFNPFILVPKDWITNDPSSNNTETVDAVYPWFTPVPGPNYSTYNTNTWNSITVGVCIPQFHISNSSDPNAAQWIVDPKDGDTLSEGLAKTKGNYECRLTLIEGFDDYWENTTLWRVRNSGGTSIDSGHSYQEYPSQRINIVRSFSNDPYPIKVELDASTCDSFYGAVGGDGSFRDGSLCIEHSNDIASLYDVYNTTNGESLTWYRIPFAGSTHILARISPGSGGGKFHILLDNHSLPAVYVPKNVLTGSWITVPAGFAPARGIHNISLVCDSGPLKVEWLKLESDKVLDGLYTIVDIPTGEPVFQHCCKVTHLHDDKYRIESSGFDPLAIGRSDPIANGIYNLSFTSDGFIAISSSRTTAGGQKSLVARVLDSNCSFIPK